MMSYGTDELCWAVVATCSAKNDGVVETWQKVCALFNYPFLAEDYIKKCLPTDRAFSVVFIGNMDGNRE